jgi:bifunctional non-homologous end joining protein LigD
MARPQVTISSPDKLYFPSGFKKVDMIRYYGAISSVMLPHLQDRPVTLIRFPEGVRGEKFYEKNAPGHAPDWIKTAKVARGHHEGFINYILVKNVETLAWCANLGAIEFHPFLHRAAQPQTPTHIAFDLDPGEGASLLTCIEVADILRGLFKKLELDCYPKVSGSKGLQLYVPLNTPVTYEQTTPFAKAVAELLAQQFPRLVVSEMPKNLRRGRVLIDWSQNSEAKTTVCVYSLRGKHDEPFVSAPVTWAELARAAKAKDSTALFFSPAETLSRVEKLGDLFEPLLTKKQKLPVTAGNGLPDAKPKSRGSLARYAEKRDFTRTAEPGAALPRRSAQGSQRRFVIQKHAASHLHYDFRLEMGDTLKSWAIPKGLPYELGVKRSAFQVEDHPIDYLSFEGTIPKGQYGGGTVMVWDIGTYEVIDGNWQRGDLKLWLSGKKLRGEWHIFRIKSDDEKPVWLIVKAGKPMKPLSAKQEKTSVLTRRSLAEIGDANDAQWDRSRPSKEPRKLRTTKASVVEPKFVAPMKPQLVTALPEGPEWLYEVKWDGFRALILKHGTKVRLLSRNEKSLARDFKDVVTAAETLTTGICVLDGEIVALDESGKPSFQALQNRSAVPANIVFYAFDLLSKDGDDWTSRPLEKRQDELARVIEGSDLRLSRVLRGTAAEVLAAVGQLGLEGVVAKRSDAPYVSGDRSSAWQKVRLRCSQEFVVGGFRPGMKPFESALVGYYEDGKLMFAGKVRPGFTPHSRAELWALIKDDEIPTCPFANLPDTEKKGRWGEGITSADMKTLRWVKPRHVIEIEFLEWTRTSHLRHAAFRGIRTDKAPRAVVRESPE